MEDYLSLEVVANLTSVRTPGAPRLSRDSVPGDISAEDFATMPPEAQQDIMTSPFYRPVTRSTPESSTEERPWTTP